MRRLIKIMVLLNVISISYACNSSLSGNYIFNFPAGAIDISKNELQSNNDFSGFDIKYKCWFGDVYKIAPYVGYSSKESSYVLYRDKTKISSYSASFDILFFGASFGWKYSDDLRVVFDLNLGKGKLEFSNSTSTINKDIQSLGYGLGIEQIYQTYQDIGQLGFQVGFGVTEYDFDSFKISDHEYNKNEIDGDVVLRVGVFFDF